MTEALSADVVVVGGGNAALAAALAAAEAGASVRLLEAAPEEERGGNSTYTAGAMRVVFDGPDALRALMPDLSERELAETDFGAYTEADYYDDMARLTRYRADPDLVEQLVTRSHDTLVWLRGKGVRYQPSYGRQAFKRGGRSLPLLGRPCGRGLGRRAGPRRVSLRGSGKGRYRRPLPGPGALSARGRRRHARCDCARRRAHGRGPCAGRGARLRRLRGQRRVAGALPRARLGPRQGARDPLQPGRRHPHGARRRCHAGRQLVGLPRGRLGPQRARIWRPRRGRRLPEAQLPVLHRRQRGRRALRRRGRGFSQLHLRRLRPPGAGAARSGGVAGLRCSGDPPAARRVPHPPGHQGEGRHAGGACGAHGWHRRHTLPSQPCGRTTTP